MKYIRTKDSIVFVGDLVKDEFGNYCPKDSTDTMEIEAKYVIKEADNIEELCDEVVVEMKFNTGYVAHLNKNITELKSFVEYLKESCKVTNDEMLNIYGAIWTDKGLIYVAQMNESGVLELLWNYYLIKYGNEYGNNQFDTSYCKEEHKSDYEYGDTILNGKIVAECDFEVEKTRTYLDNYYDTETLGGFALQKGMLWEKK